jgi:hypothetical protein
MNSSIEQNIFVLENEDSKLPRKIGIENLVFCTRL